MKHTLALSLIFGFALAACQGQNPLKHEDKSLANYRELSRQSIPETGESHAVSSQVIVNNKVIECGAPFTLEIADEDGPQLAHFVENQQKSIVIRAHANSPENDAWSIKATKIPGGVFEGSIQGHEGTYRFTWTPEVRGGNRTRTETLKFEFNGKTNPACPNRNEPQYLSLVVDKTTSAPTFQVSAFNEAVDYANQPSANFGIQFIDVTPQSGTTPPKLEIKGPGDKNFMDASHAVTCPDKNRHFDTKLNIWIWACTFDARLINDQDLQPHLRKDEKVNAQFILRAQSPSTQIEGTHSVIVPVQFSKVEGVTEAGTQDQNTSKNVSALNTIKPAKKD